MRIRAFGHQSQEKCGLKAGAYGNIVAEAKVLSKTFSHRSPTFPL